VGSGELDVRCKNIRLPLEGLIHSVIDKSIGNFYVGKWRYPEIRKV
jgi:hypothetical protein